MSEIFRPTKKHVFIKPFLDDVLPSGIIIPQLGTGNLAPTTGEILAVGSDCEQVQVGDKVLFEQGTGLRHFINGEDVLLMDEDHIEAIL